MASLAAHPACACPAPHQLPPTHPGPARLPRFYAPQLFEATGASTNAALLASVVTGIVNVVSTLVAIYLVDR